MMSLVEREAKCRVLQRKYFADLRSRDWFLDRAVSGLLRPDDTFLDAGSGTTLALVNRYAPRVAFAVGIDVEAPTIAPAKNAVVAVGDLAALPLRDRLFDVVVSRSVVEHLEHPRAVFRELGRTLKPGGRLVFTTPNKYYYSSLVAGMIPYSWKDAFMRSVFKEDSYDHYPVFYRANTRGALRRVAADAGLVVERIEALRHFPFYFLFSPTLFRLGVLYDRLVTRLGLDALQSTWLVTMRKPVEA
jgi:SAM-dependent methyltransferase